VLIIDNLSKFEYEEQEYLQITELSDNRVENESTIEFSKRGIMSHIDSQLSLEMSEEETHQWETKVNRQEVVISIKKDGSHLHSTAPYLMTQFIFDSSFHMGLIIEAFFDKEKRMEWDTSIIRLDQSELSIPNCSMIYQAVKGVNSSDVVDFFEKSMQFATNNKFYSYRSPIPNDHFMKGEYDEAQRGKTVINMCKIERRRDD
jgi:hypothetical protein